VASILTSHDARVRHRLVRYDAQVRLLPRRNITSPRVSKHHRRD